jgi:hypothetical protein
MFLRKYSYFSLKIAGFFAAVLACNVANFGEKISFFLDVLINATTLTYYLVEKTEPFKCY